MQRILFPQHKRARSRLGEQHLDLKGAIHYFTYFFLTNQPLSWPFDGDPATQIQLQFYIPSPPDIQPYHRFIHPLCHLTSLPPAATQRAASPPPCRHRRGSPVVAHVREHSKGRWHESASSVLALMLQQCSNTGLASPELKEERLHESRSITKRWENQLISQIFFLTRCIANLLYIILWNLEIELKLHSQDIENRGFGRIVMISHIVYQYSLFNACQFHLS